MPMTNPVVRAAEEAAEISLQLALEGIENQQRLLADSHLSAKGRLSVALANKTDNSDLVTKLNVAKSAIVAIEALPGYTSKYDFITRGLISAAKVSLDTAITLLEVEQAILDSLHLDISNEINTALTDKEENQKLIDSLKDALKAVKKAKQAS